MLYNHRPARQDTISRRTDELMKDHKNSELQRYKTTSQYCKPQKQLYLKPSKKAS